MDEVPFYKTAMGRDFYERRVPQLILAIQRLAAVLERIDERAERDALPKDAE